MQQAQRQSSPDTHLVITHATLQEQEKIIEILEERALWLASKGITKQWPIGQFSTPEFREKLASKIAQNELYLAWHGGAVAGTMIIQPAGEFDDELWEKIASPISREEAFYLHGLAVRVAYSGQDIGHRLLEEGKSIARAAGKRALRLDCWASNSALCHYYQQAGFTLMGIVGETWKGACWEYNLTGYEVSDGK